MKTDPPEFPDWDALRGKLQDGGATPEVVDRYDEIVSRRAFFGLVGRGGVATALLGAGAGSYAALSGLFGRGLIPEAWAEEAAQSVSFPGKPDMIVHSTRPVNGEFAPHDLADRVTPTARMFVRNNGTVPARAESRDPRGWKLTIDGEVNRPLEISLDQLRQMPATTVHACIECGGNGRALFNPQPRGNPWGRGAISCSEWKGVRLADLLREAGLKNSAVYTGHYGEDLHLGGKNEPPISRGIPIEKAMEEHTLVAYEVNGEELPGLNGYPVRLVVPGWVGSCSHKWLTRIWVRNQVHDGPKMGGYSYRVPAYPVRPGEVPPESDMVIATSWVIKSMITSPAENSSVKAGQKLKVRGHAWAGEDKVKHVLISTDFGIHWDKARLSASSQKYAWNEFEAEVSFPGRGYYEIWARAFDDQGGSQPVIQPWNPRGYLGNVVHRVPVTVSA